MKHGKNVAMWPTSVDCRPAGAFHGPMVVSMRPIPAAQLSKAVTASARFPNAHGAPVHIGDPKAIFLQKAGDGGRRRTVRKRDQGHGSGNRLFAWAGGIEPGEGHYYRIQGTGFLLEYDNTQNNANHIHTVWRDYKHDFGDDLLKRHYDQTAHEK